MLRELREIEISQDILNDTLLAQLTRSILHEYKNPEIKANVHALRTFWKSGVYSGSNSNESNKEPTTVGATSSKPSTESASKTEKHLKAEKGNEDEDLHERYATLVAQPKRKQEKGSRQDAKAETAVDPVPHQEGTIRISANKYGLRKDDVVFVVGERPLVLKVSKTIDGKGIKTIPINQQGHGWGWISEPLSTNRTSYKSWDWNHE